MIVIRFLDTFRERAPEWVLAAGLLGWGLLTLYSPGLFQVQEFFHPLLIIMSQFEWGITAFTVGLIRLIFLAINGALRPSAHIRAIGCVFGAGVWGSLLICSVSLNWITPTSFLYTAVLVLDLLSLWFAAGDAKLADIKARKRS